MSNKVLQSSDLSQLVSTKNDYSDLDLVLTLAEQIVLKNDQKFPTKTQLSQISYAQYSVLEQLWDVATALDPEITWPTFIETLQKLVAEALDHVITLSLAYRPTLKQVDELAAVITTELQTGAVLEVVYKLELVAGCEIATNGKSLDYSLETWLPAYLAKLPTT